MAAETDIEWTDATWNPITGCTLVSEGCRHCYAARLAATRLQHHPSRAGLARLNAAGEAKFTGEVRFNREWLDQPLRWKKPRMIFVCAHGDLFHESAPDEWIDQVFAIMMMAPQHTFQVLTKRTERMRAYLANPETGMGKRHLHTVVQRVQAHVADFVRLGRFEVNGFGPVYNEDWARAKDKLRPLPLPNVWLGTSVEDQPTAETRIPYLLQTPAALRWISAEPLLGPVRLDLLREDHADGHSTSWESALNGKRFDPWSDGDIGGMPKLDWVVAGGESGPVARPMHPDWARSLRDQCAAAGVPFFFKQWGAFAPVETDVDAFSRPAAERAGEMVVGDDGQFSQAAIGQTFEVMRRVGKSAAGALLDGVEHKAWPVRA